MSEPKKVSVSKFTFHYVSIKSFSLVPMPGRGYLFTFHYVSIKSARGLGDSSHNAQFTFHYVSIKSLTDKAVISSLIPIYIPLCFY